MDLTQEETIEQTARQISPQKPQLPPTEVPVRFQPSKSTLLIDRFMTHFIKVGGISIIAAVLGIFIFIFWQILPLFRGARVQPVKTISVPRADYRILGVDEWTEYPFLMTPDGKLTFVDISGKRKTETIDPGYIEQKSFTAFRYSPERQAIILGTSDGHFSIVNLNYQSAFEKGKRTITQQAKAEHYYALGKEGNPIRDVSCAITESEVLVLGIQDVDGKLEVPGVTLTRTQSLLGTSEITVSRVWDFTSSVSGKPQRTAINAKGTDLLIVNEGGDVFYFVNTSEGIKLRQHFTPFEDLDDRRVQLMEFMLGGSSVVFSSHSGMNRIFSLFQREGGDVRLFGRIHELERLPESATFYDVSLRNKGFLIGGGSFASLRYSTTESVRWLEKLPFKIQHAALSGKYNSILFLDQESKLHIYSLQDPHPESSWKALFGKIWYEGTPKPEYSWQSTGGTDDFEPKLSMIPLIIGTLKGTLFAMLFAVPIALLAAVYTSQFLHPNFKTYVKPTMEIMASLPSVVLGFLAALWIAPLIETRVPSVMIILIAIPVAAFLCGWLWNLLPIRFRIFVKPGYEWIVFLPILLMVVYLGWILGPAFEKIFFVVTDPSSGQAVADFRLWWPQVTGLPFEQRNSLVVGFMMGFAVIPIVFTITEDALSNVPGALRSGSLALGASRWQTAMRIVVPTASAGIFSAIMIGLGRAVGETMIVVMATGNTPILDFNIFSGMRTLSANIAVELPEAPYHGTLYRSLFLGGMVLFVITFLINTLAEIMRQHLREKYKTI